MALVLRLIGALLVLSGALVLVVQIALAATSPGSTVIVVVVFGVPALACFLLARRLEPPRA
jgi:predicted membrane channel-forming protein YqfA (hemolysin III family)